MQSMKVNKPWSSRRFPDALNSKLNFLPCQGLYQESCIYQDFRSCEYQTNTAPLSFDLVTSGSVKLFRFGLMSSWMLRSKYELKKPKRDGFRTQASCEFWICRDSRTCGAWHSPQLAGASWDWAAEGKQKRDLDCGWFGRKVLKGFHSKYGKMVSWDVMTMRCHEMSCHEMSSIERW